MPSRALETKLEEGGGFQHPQTPLRQMVDVSCFGGGSHTKEGAKFIYSVLAICRAECKTGLSRLTLERVVFLVDQWRFIGVLRAAQISLQTHARTRFETGLAGCKTAFLPSPEFAD